MKKSRLVVVVAFAVAGCNWETTYHLFSRGDPMRYSVAVPPVEWRNAEFDDARWPLAAGMLGPLLATEEDPSPACRARGLFQVGPRADDFRKLKLSLDADGRYVASINGVVLAEAPAGGGSELELPPGLLKPRDNVLALEYYPTRPVEFEIAPTLDGGPEAPSRPALTKGPYLLAPSEESVTIAWETSQAVPSRAIVDGVAHDGGSGRHHLVRVGGLLPSHAYRYHVEVGERRSETFTAATAAQKGELVRFGVYGDNRTGGDVHRRLVGEMVAAGPDFLVNTGDMVGMSDESEWEAFFTLEYPLLGHTPLSPCIGNHEAEFGANTDRYQELFPIGRPELGGRVYSVDYGDVHVVMLDSNGDLARQAEWLDGDLGAARHNGARHLFLAMHWGPYSSGSTHNHGSNGEAQRTIVPVARAHGVRAVFGGHDHFYERGDAHGLAYFVTGGGGAPLNGAGHIRETRVSRAAHHYLMVDVAGEAVRVTAYELSGAVLDEVTLSPRP
jgi:hypothetical protein